jgi:hypothetical protein
MRREITILGALLLLLAPMPAAAFCGFYVGGADQSLYNDATMVVLLRDGDTTVLSMQNSYQGPPEGFAMVVPVPEVLSEDNVRTLSPSVFARVDRLAAPRLVEYWERDPCAPDPRLLRMAQASGVRPGARRRSDATEGLGVTVEAQFEVGEYEIVILSAADSAGLDTWLRQEGYNIPAGAEPALRPYVAAGTKFFVARVNVERVTFVEGRAVLSPLRVHYTSERFELPVRLGLINSQGTQDLLVHILARQQRYEVANYPNELIPTNLVVDDSVRESFGAFYTALFDRTLERHPGAVITEYAWGANNCDPCPGPVLTASDLVTLGSDVVGGGTPTPTPTPMPRTRRRPMPGALGWTLTRLHYRYGADGLDEDLVFRPAPAIVGGRGTPDAEGRLDPAPQTTEGRQSNFQGRYVILHPWEGPAACEAPQRGRWGGPPGGGTGQVRPAVDLATQPRGRVTLASTLRVAVPSLGFTPGQPDAPAPAEEPADEAPPSEESTEEAAVEEAAAEAPPATAPEEEARGPSCAAAGAPDLGLLLALLLPFVPRRRRRR